jgi:hypothetical protein
MTPSLHSWALDDATVRVDNDQLDGITSGACGAHPRREALDLAKASAAVGLRSGET